MTNQRIAPTGKIPLIELPAEPPNYETPLEYFREGITPNDGFPSRSKPSLARRGPQSQAAHPGAHYGRSAGSARLLLYGIVAIRMGDGAPHEAASDPKSRARLPWTRHAGQAQF